jgi:hypothetical protein
MLRFLLILSIYSISPLNGNDKGLVIIERSRDTDKIHYQINLTDSGNINQDEPITIFWKRHTKNGIEEPLTWIQNNFSYGLKYKSIDHNEAVFQFVGYSKRNFQLKRNQDGLFCVFTESKGEFVELNKIFIQIDGGTLWVPEISRIEIHSKLVNNGAIFQEILKPDKFYSA